MEELQRRASTVFEEYRTLLHANPDAIALPIDQIEAGCVNVAERAGEILGFSVVLRRTDGDAELDGLFVEPRAWRNGIGKFLVAHAERRAMLDGARSLHVVANPRAEEFYLACGFAFAGEQQTRFGMARTMRKPVALERPADSSFGNGGRAE